MDNNFYTDTIRIGIANETTCIIPKYRVKYLHSQERIDDCSIGESASDFVARYAQAYAY